MGKIAFVFSGQGAQAPGMGLGLYEASEAAKKVFQAADEVRPGTSKMCFYGTDGELKITANTQPCLYAVEMAAAAALTEAGIKADMAAGFSLGELASLTYAGSMDLKTGMELVNRRAQLMQDAAGKYDTAMVAVVKLTNEKVEELCAGFDNVYPVNYNCPGQVTVAALSERIPAFSAAVKEAGGRAIPVKVSGAFHSPYMAGASDGFRKEIEKTDLKVPEIPVYSNWLGDVYTEDVKGILGMQISSPVKWEAIVRKMIAAGADTFIELGAGKTLSGFIRKIDDSVRRFSAENKEDLNYILDEVKG